MAQRAISARLHREFFATFCVFSFRNIVCDPIACYMLTMSTTNLERTSILLPADVMSRLDSIAEREDRSRGAVIRRIIQQALSDHAAAHAEAGRRFEALRSRPPYAEDSGAPMTRFSYPAGSHILAGKLRLVRNPRPPSRLASRGDGCGEGFYSREPEWPAALLQRTSILNSDNLPACGSRALADEQLRFARRLDQDARQRAISDPHRRPASGPVDQPIGKSLHARLIEQQAAEGRARVEAMTRGASR